MLFSMFFLAHWFFGNLYEEIVLVPNQLANSYDALKRWQGYFTITNQIYYYVPFTQLAVLILVYLYFVTKQPLQKQLLKKAAVFGLLALGITIVIVTQLNLKIFFGDLAKFKEKMFVLSLLWLIGNAVRLYFVGSAFYFAFKLFVIRQRDPATG